MTENNEMPEEMKNNNFAIKNAKKYESISEKMKKILESSEKLLKFLQKTRLSIYLKKTGQQ